MEKDGDHGYGHLRVAALLGDKTSCGHFRVINPLTTLQQQYGTEITLLSVVSPEEVLALDVDVLIVQRRFEPWVPQVIEEMKRRGVTVVFELDDNIHEVPPQSPAFNFYKMGAEVHKRVPLVIGNCCGMVTSTWDMHRYYRRMQKNIHVVENQIDFNLRDWDTPVTEKPKDRLILGWSGASQHQADLPIVKEVIPRILKRYSFVDIAIYANSAFGLEIADLWNVPPHRLIILGHCTFKHYPYWLGFFDIGIAPIENSEFNRAKCLDASSFIPTNRGLLPIAEVEPGDMVWNGTRFVRVTAKQAYPRTRGLLLVTRSGHEIKLTDDHRLMGMYGECMAGNLKLGSWVRMMPIRLPDRSPYTEAHAFVAGLLVRGFPKNAELTDAARELMREAGIQDPDQFLRLNGAQMRKEWISRHELPNRSVPYWLSQQQVPYFLAGVLCSKAYIEQHGVVLLLGDENLSRQLQMLLESEGVPCARYRSSSRPRISIAIRPLHEMIERNNLKRLIPERLADMIRALSLIVGSDIGDIRQGWFDKVGKVFLVDIAPVDIQVDGEWFCAEGFYSHNSALKPLEYGARGVPSVCSNVAPYRRLYNAHPGCILLADSNSQWEEAICSLIEDEQLRARTREHIGQVVREHYDLRKNVHLWPDTWAEIRRRYEQGDYGPDPSVPRPKPPDRNDPCPCGSGKKYSKCCWRAWG